MEKYRESDIPVRPRPLSPPPPKKKGGKSPANPHLSPLCAAVGYGADAIESANIVGFHNQNWMPASFVMMGGQFEKTDGTAVKLSEINFGEDFQGPYWGEGIDEFSKTAPQIQLAFPNSEGTAKYYFVADGKEMPDGSWGPGWVDAKENEADPDVELGLGFWYKDSFNVARFLGNAGQVLGDASWEKDFNKTFRMLVNPYPVATKLSEITFVDIEKDATEWGDGIDDFSKTATQIQIPFSNSEGFTKLYFLADGKEMPDGSWGPGWVDAKENTVDPETIVIPAGRGCWFRPCTNFKADKMTVIFNAK